MSNLLPDNLVAQLIQLVPSTRLINQRFNRVATETQRHQTVNDLVVGVGLVPITRIGIDVQSVDRLAMRAWWIDGLHQVLTGQLTDSGFYQVVEQLRTSGLSFHYYDFVWAVIAVSHIEWFIGDNSPPAIRLLTMILHDVGPIDHDRSIHPIMDAYDSKVVNLSTEVEKWLHERNAEPEYDWEYDISWAELLNIYDNPALNNLPVPSDPNPGDPYATFHRIGFDLDSLLTIKRVVSLTFIGAWRIVCQYLNSGFYQNDYEQPTRPSVDRVDNFIRTLNNLVGRLTVIEPAFYMTLHYIAPFLSVLPGPTEPNQVVVTDLSSTTAPSTTAPSTTAPSTTAPSTTAPNPLTIYEFMGLLPSMPPSLRRRVLSFVPERYRNVAPIAVLNDSDSLKVLISGQVSPTDTLLARLDRPVPVASLFPFEIGNVEVLEVLMKHWTCHDLELLHRAFWDRVFITNDNTALLERFWHAIGQPPVPINYTRYAHSPRCQHWLLVMGLMTVSDDLLGAIGENFYHWKEFNSDFDWDLLLLWRTVSIMMSDRQRQLIVNGLLRTLLESKGVYNPGTSIGVVSLAWEMVEQS